MVESSNDKPLVLITGITGYLGSWVTRTFLEDGRYRVRGTVRDKTNEKKIQPLRDGFGEELFNSIELVEADLLKPETIENACEGCQIIVHTASPFPNKKPKNEDELITPAREGTLAALRGAQKHGAKRVVVTSSMAAIFETGEPTEFLNEECWSKPEI
jgi:nucleoside-diphosphate-sugar epimerase